MNLISTDWRKIWKRASRIAVPAGGQFGAMKLMRTADVLITAAISPAAVVALGLSDLLMRLPGRTSNGFVVGVNTLVSQDTGSGSNRNRGQALTQASVISLLVTLPFVVAFLAYGGELLRAIGASTRSVQLGVTYLAVVAWTAPMDAVRKVAANALRGIGDANTPMYVTIPMDALNIVLSLSFGLGWFGVPDYGIRGIGAATVVATAAGTVALLGYLQFFSSLHYPVPRNPRITRQLVRIAAPASLTGIVTAAAVFPFNQLLLSVGTAVNAGYQLAWRTYTQVAGPVSRGLSVAGQTLVGQYLGDTMDDERPGSFESVTLEQFVTAVLLLTGSVAVVLGVVTTAIADVVVDALSSGRSREVATGFLVFFGVITPIFVTNHVTTGMLQGGSETRIPLLSRLLGMYGGMVGISYLGLEVGLGVRSFYLGLLACYASMLAATFGGLVVAGWDERARGMIRDRSSPDGD